MATIAVNTYLWIDDAIFESLEYLFEHGQEVDTGHWQGVATEGRPDLVTKEIINLQWTARIPEDMEEAVALIGPNMPWAEDHFHERVSKDPSNPGKEFKNWPWWTGQTEETMIGGKFTHTYQERFWPTRIEGPQPMGIRYSYGDLDSVIGLLSENPHTRQATLPIFFPEDTGAVHGGRIPCTLHYHFMLRQNKLHLWYPIRSCDAIRHFRDDIYMAVRLVHYVLDRLYDPATLWAGVEPGMLNFNAYSFHVHQGDIHRYEKSEAPRLSRDRGQDR
jgi:thymidylate synthase